MDQLVSQSFWRGTQTRLPARFSYTHVEREAQSDYGKLRAPCACIRPCSSKWPNVYLRRQSPRACRLILAPNSQLRTSFRHQEEVADEESRPICSAPTWLSRRTNVSIFVAVNAGWSKTQHDNSSSPPISRSNIYRPSWAIRVVRYQMLKAVKPSVLHLKLRGTSAASPLQAIVARASVFRGLILIAAPCFAAPWTQTPIGRLILACRCVCG